MEEEYNKLKEEIEEKGYVILKRNGCFEITEPFKSLVTEKMFYKELSSTTSEKIESQIEIMKLFIDYIK